ncbi:oxygenase MpaB family protein [Sandaracinus amylolyticus]|uniref:ER-bound oxygenase mpaB/mpaB'/Rubber oxygenase catalytic domain-containing protein n=1 Tax=Sandaracinus amylolyticus TaxID=927083 RepID=A0A0F6W891_9BACT|nr:oxygenase MpaB family protein [Sandaracinus amylolyticus]AKF09821.1 hypothetical protein DB32_006970 [Sandaracinus amylolyticus]
MTAATVTRDELERRIAEVRARTRDPRAGIYGPGSISWRINREGIIMLGGGRAALLQLAHPYVAHAVDQHSDTRRDPVGRFRRTFMHVFAMVFGDLDHAIESARRVHRIHTGIKGPIREDVGAYRDGHRYHANDPEALFWVHATLVDTAVMLYELGVAPLTREEKERYYAESRLFAGLFGIPERVMPRSFAELEEYMRAMMASETITVGRPALEIAAFLLQPPRPSAAPFVAWYRVLTAGLLPPRLREQLELPFGPRERAIFERSIPLLRATYRTTPKRLRYFPDYVEAKRRLAGKPAHDAFGRALEKIALRAIEPVR